MSKQKPSTTTCETLGKGLRLLAETCKMRDDERLTEQKIKAYELFVGNQNPEVLRAAILEWGRTQRFFPTPSEIRDECHRQKKKLEMEQTSKQITERPPLELTDGEVVPVAQLLDAPEFKRAVERIDMAREHWKPRQMTADEYEQRLNYLKDQARKLGA